MSRLTPQALWPILVGMMFALGLASRVESADMTPKDIRERIDAVAKLLAAGKPDEAASSLAAGIEGLQAMQAKPQAPAGFKLLSDRAAAARKALEKAGVDVTRLEVPAPAATVPVPLRPASAPPQAAAGVSFARQVAPMLVRSCGGCHVSGRRGNFQMASYQGLMASGMVQRGAGNASRLVEMILSGDMPRGGGRVSADDVGMLISWIDRGATCDADSTASLEMLARGGAAGPAPAPPPAMAAAPAPLKPGDVAFSTDVAPILLEKCGMCHGARDPENNFQMTTLVLLVKGGRTGATIVPGKAADSLIVKKLRGVGIEGQRMPLNAPPLPNSEIALIEKWINQGGRIDLLTPSDPLEKVVAVGKAQRLSDDELAVVRQKAAELLWGRMIPDEQPFMDRREGLLVLGNLPEQRLKDLADKAADVAGFVRREILASDTSLLKGGVVLYAFRNSYDYSALWQVVKGAERPKRISGNAGTSGDVIYAAILVPSQDESGDTTRAILAEQIAAAALAGRGFPAWFSLGVGRAVAMKAAPKAAAVQDWKRELGAAIKQLGSAEDFLAGRADPAATATAAGGFVSSLASAGKLAQCVALVDGGMSFDDAFTKIFRSPPQQAFTTWAARNTGR